MIIGEILSKKGSAIQIIDHDQPFSVATTMMHETSIGCVIIVHSRTKQMLGMVSQPEILTAINSLGASALNHYVTDIMRKPVPICHVLDNAAAAMAYMTAERTRHLVAVNENGEVCGIVSIGDTVAAQLQESKVEIDILRDMARTRALAA